MRFMNAKNPLNVALGKLVILFRSRELKKGVLIKRDALLESLHMPNLKSSPKYLRKDKIIFLLPFPLLFPIVIISFSPLTSPFPFFFYIISLEKLSLRPWKAKHIPEMACPNSHFCLPPEMACLALTPQPFFWVMNLSSPGAYCRRWIFWFPQFSPNCTQETK